MQARKRALIAAAVLSALGGATSAFGGNVYWDINGTADGSGATAGVASGAWDGINTFWNSDPTGGAAGTLTTDVGAANTGVFSAGTDATGTSQVTLLGGNTVTVGGLQVLTGTVPITTSGGTGSGIMSLPNATTTFNVAAGATLSIGVNANPILLSGSGLIVQSGAGTIFNNNNATFTGKWDITSGVMQILNGNTAAQFGVTPATFTPDLITLDGGTLQTVNNTSAQFGTTRGITIGPNGGTFDIEGNPAGVGSVSFNGKITGSAPITVEGKGVAFAFVDNSSSYTGKWILTGSETNPNVSGADVGLGAVPASYEADAVTFNGGSLRVSTGTTMTVPVNRGFTLLAGGGRLHPIGTGSLVVNSIITGGGPLTINVAGEGGPQTVILSATNSYTGATTVAAGTLNLTGSLASTNVSVPAGSSILNVSGSLAAATALTVDGTANFTNASQTLASLTSVGATGNVNLNGPTALTIGSGSYSGNISNAGGSIIKNTSGFLGLYGNDSYGNTSVSLGTLLAFKPASLPGYTSSGHVSVSNGGTLAVSAGGAVDWVTPNIDTLLANVNFASGSAFGISVDPSNSFTYNSNLTLPIGFTKIGAGTLLMGGANTYTGPTIVTGGRLTLGQSLTTSSAIVVQTGGIAELAAGNNKIIKTSAVTITGTGQLDLQDNKLAVVGGTLGTWNGTAYTGITGLIQTGRNGGAWNGGGIITSQSSAVGATALTTLGVAVAGDISKTTLNGVSVSPTDVIAMYTYAGDANLSGKITGDDYFRIDQGFSNHMTGYENGDFNYDGRIDADDYFIIDSNYVKQGTAFSAGAPVGGVSAVPEPAGIALLGVAAMTIGRRRRRTIG